MILSQDPEIIRSQYENLMDAIANFIASDIEAAQEYLIEEGIDIEESLKRTLALIERLKNENNS